MRLISCIAVGLLPCVGNNGAHDSRKLLLCTLLVRLKACEAINLGLIPSIGLVFTHS